MPLPALSNLPIYRIPDTSRFAGATLLAPFKTSVVLSAGYGPPTFTRASYKGIFDNEGKAIWVKPGAVTFGGARGIQNLFAAPSATLATQGVSVSARVYTVSFYGTGTITFSGAYVGSPLVGTGVGVRVQRTFTATLGTLTCTVTGTCSNGQLEDVTGQADTTASEYVSVGVEPAPAYHGAMVDGVKWFNTHKNGTPIDDRLLLGIHGDPVDKTNTALHCRDLSQNAWRSSGTGTALYTNDGSLIAGWSATTGIAGTIFVVNGVELEVTSTAAFGGGFMVIPNMVVGGTYVVSFDYMHQSGAVSSFTYASITNGAGSETTPYPNGNAMTTTSASYVRGQITFTADSLTHKLIFRTNTTGAKGRFKNISISAVGIKATKTGTGIDGLVNGCSVIECMATGATISQQIILASAAACSGSWVKRQTGAGTVEFSRNDGATWLDITGNLSTGGFYITKIENTTLANPVIMFRMGTVGDRLIIDAVLNHPGTTLTLPIISEATAVTRNADVLSYPISGNLDFAQGSVYATYRPTWGTWENGSIFGSTTRGLYASAVTSGAEAHDGTNVATGLPGTPVGQQIIGMAWDADGLAAINGYDPGASTSYDLSFNLFTLNILPGVGGYIRNLAGYPVADVNAGPIVPVPPVGLGNLIFAAEFAGVTIGSTVWMTPNNWVNRAIVGTDTNTNYPPPTGAPLYALTTNSNGYGIHLSSSVPTFDVSGGQNDAAVNQRWTNAIENDTVFGVPAKILRITRVAPGGATNPGDYMQQGWYKIQRYLTPAADLPEFTIRYDVNVGVLTNKLNASYRRWVITDCKTGDYSTGGDYRYMAALVRADVNDSNLYGVPQGTYGFEIQGDDKANPVPDTGVYKYFYTVRAFDKQVPQSQWFTMEMYWKRAVDKNDLLTGEHRLRIKRAGDSDFVEVLYVKASTLPTLLNPDGRLHINQHMGANKSKFERLFIAGLYGGYNNMVDQEIKIANVRLYDGNMAP